MFGSHARHGRDSTCRATPAAKRESGLEERRSAGIAYPEQVKKVHFRDMRDTICRASSAIGPKKLGWRRIVQPVACCVRASYCAYQTHGEQRFDITLDRPLCYLPTKSDCNVVGRCLAACTDDREDAPLAIGELRVDITGVEGLQRPAHHPRDKERMVDVLELWRLHLLAGQHGNYGV